MVIRGNKAPFVTLVISSTDDKSGVAVPIPREPRKNDVSVVVEMSDPTVSCDVVATSEPEAFVVTTEFAGPLKDDPPPIQLLLIAKHPVVMLKPTAPVVVPLAPPRMERACKVVVPFWVIEKGLLLEVVANVVADEVAR